MTSKRTHKIERLARIYDGEILPVWGQRFGKMLVRGASVPERGQVLDVACGTGFVAAEIVRRMPANARLIAIDDSSAMLDVARQRLADLSADIGKRSVYFRSESAVPKLSFAAEVYDLVLCNLGLAEMPSMPAALRDFARVARRGGEVRCTLALEGSFQQFYDLYREVLIKHDKHDALERLDEHLQRYPSGDTAAGWLEDAGLEATVEVEEFSLLFRSSREFFFAPVIEYGPLSGWKDIAGRGQELQDVFWYIKEAIDAYFGGRAFEVTVKAGCLIGRKREDGVVAPPPGRRSHVASISDGDTDQDDTGSPASSSSGSGRGEEISVRTSELDLLEIEELSPGDSDLHQMPAQSIDDDVELDAFIEGRPRPRHLDED